MEVGDYRITVKSFVTATILYIQPIPGLSSDGRSRGFAFFSGVTGCFSSILLCSAYQLVCFLLDRRLLAGGTYGEAGLPGMMRWRFGAGAVLLFPHCCSRSGWLHTRTCETEVPHWCLPEIRTVRTQPASTLHNEVEPLIFVSAACERGESPLETDRQSVRINVHS